MELRLYARKGTALEKLGKVNDAITEFERALLIEPNNKALLNGIQALRMKWIYFIFMNFKYYIYQYILLFFIT